MNRMPMFFHPTRIALIDDDRAFLQHIDAFLEPHGIRCQLFDKASAVVPYLEQFALPSPAQQKWISRQEDAEALEERILDLKIGDLHKKVFDPNRFDQISVVVADYDMPGINGIEILRQINNPTVQKILLTGVADHHLGIEALNKGLIHQYIQKQDPNLAVKLKEAIENAQREAFCKTTSIIELTLSQSNDDTALSEATFLALFNECRSRSNAIEYYLLDASGSFLFFDASGRSFELSLQSKERMDSNYELAEGTEAEEQTLASLRDYRKLISYHSSQIRPANRLAGRREYYHAFGAGDVNIYSIHSYNDFLRDYDAGKIG